MREFPADVDGTLGLDFAFRDVSGVQSLPALDTDFFHPAVHLRAEGLQCQLAVIASLHWFLDVSLAVGIESSKE